MIAVAIAVAASAWPIAAQAQFWGGNNRYPYGREPYPQQPRGSFGFPFFERPFNPPYAPRAAPTESYRAPAPHKPATPPAKTVLVIGDSLADWLGYGLEEVYADTPDTGVVRKVKPSFGLVRTEPRSDVPEWSQLVKDALTSEQPVAIVVMLGLNDRASLRDRVARAGVKPAPPGGQPAPSTQPGPSAQQAQNPKQSPTPGTAPQPEAESSPSANAPRLTPGASYEFRTTQWAELYEKRIGELITALKSKGVPVLWVGLPAIRGPKATSDMNYLDDLYRESAERAGIIYVNIWDGFVDESGRYVVQGPDFEGQTRRLRSGDGVHFTKFGAVKLAHLVDQELKHVLLTHVAPIALPSAGATPAKPGTVKPAIGPVLPLTTAGGGEGGNLLGGGSTGQVHSDPEAERVLVRGDPVTAPFGRADNFTWPPSAAASPTPPPAAPAAAAPAAAAPAPPPPASANRH